MDPKIEDKVGAALVRTGDKFLRDFVVVLSGLVGQWVVTGSTLNWESLTGVVALALYRTARDIIPSLYHEYFGQELPK